MSSIPLTLLRILVCGRLCSLSDAIKMGYCTKAPVLVCVHMYLYVSCGASMHVRLCAHLFLLVHVIVCACSNWLRTVRKIYI